MATIKSTCFTFFFFFLNKTFWSEANSGELMASVVSAAIPTPMADCCGNDLASSVQERNYCAAEQEGQKNTLLCGCAQFASAPR